jgi:hypothetical protein
MEIVLLPEAGNEPFVFSTDFPHESFDAKHCRRQIDELLARDDDNQADKEAILATNAKRFLRHCLETGETFWPNRLNDLNALNPALHGSHHDHQP